MGNDGEHREADAQRAFHWYARYRAPDGRQRTKTFHRKADAERYLTGVESAKLVGTYIEPALSRLTVGEWAARWLDGQAHLKPSTRERYAGILREHVLPRCETSASPTCHMRTCSPGSWNSPGREPRQRCTRSIAC